MSKPQCGRFELGHNSLKVSLHKPDHTSFINKIIAFTLGRAYADQ